MFAARELEEVVASRSQGLGVGFKAVVFAALLLNDQSGFGEFLEVVRNRGSDRFLTRDMAADVAGSGAAGTTVAGSCFAGAFFGFTTVVGFIVGATAPGEELNDMATGGIAERFEDGRHHFVFHGNDYALFISIKLEILRISF